MSQESQEKPGGNTKITRPKYQLYCWFFTLRMEECEASQLSQLLRQIAKKFTFSGERGDGGFEHWQGCFSLRNKEYFDTVKNYFPISIHLEPCKNFFKSVNYCKKEETHIEGPYDENSKFIKTITELYPWQKRARDICLEEPDDRSIYWFWEPDGCKGKTQFCKYMVVHHGACVLGNGAFKDLAQAIPDAPIIVLFNITRDLEDRINYSAIEAIKDGLMFSAKYESHTKVFNSPHVLIFANYEPRMESMSRDRWIIQRL